MRVLGNAGVGLVLGLVLSVSASAQVYQWKVKSSVTDVYIRSNPNGFMIGTLYANDSFRWTHTNGGDFWGRCGGTAQKCAWVPATYLTPGGTANIVCSGSGSTATGIGSRQHLLATHAKCVNDYVPGVFFIDSSSGSRVHIVSGLTAHLYGNYDGTSFHHQITSVALDSSAVLDWRWISDSGEAVVVKLQNGPWAFMRRDKLPTTLRYKDDVFRTDSQGQGN
jgi:hypothetical protein